MSKITNIILLWVIMNLFSPLLETQYPKNIIILPKFVTKNQNKSFMWLFIVDCFEDDEIRNKMLTFPGDSNSNFVGFVHIFCHEIITWAWILETSHLLHCVSLNKFFRHSFSRQETSSIRKHISGFFRTKKVI